jgi:hypothetical protein
MMSGFTRIPDSRRASRKVRKVPTSDMMLRSINYLAGIGLQVERRETHGLDWSMRSTRCSKIKKSPVKA